MADLADHAAAESEVYLSVAINNARRAAAAPTHTSGRCHWCGDPVPREHTYCDTYCDTYCRDDHAKHTRFRK